MKKRILVIVTALMVMSISAFAAGPYFTLENEGLTLGPALTFGCDWQTTIGDVQTGPTFGGDISLAFDDILAPIAVDNLWNFGLNFALDWGVWRIESISSLVVNPELYPDKIEITRASRIGAKIVGVLDPVEVWGGVRFKYVEEAKWEPVLFFGIDVHWDL